MTQWSLRSVFPGLLTLVLVLFPELEVRAQISLQDAVGLALNNHPQLKVARSDIAIAQARLIDAGKLENPVFEFSLASQAKDGPEREGSIFMGYSQAFPVTDKLLRQRDLGVAEVRLACAEVQEAERKLIGQVHEAYIEAAGAQALIKEIRRIELSTQKSIDLAREQLAVAQSSELDIAAAETEKALASQDRILAEGSYRQALAKLRPLLRIPPAEPVSLSQDLNSLIATLRPTVGTGVPQEMTRSDIVAAEVRFLRALADQELARSEARQDWEMAAGYEAERAVDEPMGAERDRILSMGVKIPLPVRKKGAGRIAEAQATAEKSCHEVEAIKLVSRGEVEAALADVQAAERNASVLEEKILPQLVTREEQTRRAYQEGLADFSQIVLLQQQQTRTLKAVTSAKLDKALALARLQHALGSHPHLQTFCVKDCPPYRAGTEPADAPWALPALKAKGTGKLRAEPVSSEAVRKPFQGWFRKLGSNRG